jgi:hypothetical protein
MKGVRTTEANKKGEIKKTASATNIQRKTTTGARRDWTDLAPEERAAGEIEAIVLLYAILAQFVNHSFEIFPAISCADPILLLYRTRSGIGSETTQIIFYCSLMTNIALRPFREIPFMFQDLAIELGYGHILVD